MEVYVIMLSYNDKDKGDEVKGYYPSQTQADDYCRHKNQITDKGSYYWEEAKLLQPV